MADVISLDALERKQQRERARVVRTLRDFADRLERRFANFHLRTPSD